MVRLPFLSDDVRPLTRAFTHVLEHTFKPDLNYVIPTNLASTTGQKMMSQSYTIRLEQLWKFSCC